MSEGTMFKDHLLELGYACVPIQDGRIHRFKAGARDRGKSGWYVYYPEGITVWGDWREGVAHKHYDGKSVSELTRAERDQIERRAREAERQRLEEQRRVADWCGEYYPGLADCPASNAYLSMKGVHPVDGLKEDEAGSLVIPVWGLFDGKLKVMSLETISVDRYGKSSKRFKSGGKKTGGFFLIGKKSPGMYLAEGIATALSIYEATHTSTVCGFDAGNLRAVSELFPRTRLTVVADNDKSKTGENGARATGRKVVLIPRIDGIKGTDANDYAQRYGLDALRAGLEEGRWMH